MIDYIKNHKKKFLTITGIVCAVALSVGIIFGTVTNHRSFDTDNNNYAESKHYAASIDASEVVEYIKAVTYTELDKLNDEYKINLTVAELYDNTCIESICNRCVDTLASAGIDADMPKIMDTSVDITCRAHLTTESREHIALMIAEQMTDYVADLNLDMIDKSDFCEKVKDTAIRILNQEKDDVNVNIEMITSDNDIIAQILMSNGMQKDAASQVSGNLLTGLSVVYADMDMPGTEYLTDDRIARIAVSMSEEIYTSVSSAITSYNENVNNITESINKFSEQYVTMQNDINGIQSQITVLETQGKDAASNASEYVAELTRLQSRLSETQSQLNDLASNISDLTDIRDRLTLLSVLQDSAKSDLENSVSSLKNDINALMESLKNESSKADDDTRKRFESEVSNLQGITDRLDADKLTINEFNTYKSEITKLITQLKDSSASGMDSVGTTLSEKLDKVSINLEDYKIASDAKYASDKAVLEKKIGELKDKVDGDKKTLENSIAALNSDLASTINSLDGKVDANNADAKAALNNLKKLQEDLQSGKVSMSDYEIAVSNINSNLVELETATGKKFDNVKSDVDKVNNDLSEYKKSVASRLDAMSSAINGNKENFDKSISDLNSSLTTTIDSLEGKVDANNADANAALNNLKHLQADLQSGKVSVSDYEKVIADINGNISTLEAATGEKFESVKSDVRGLNSALEAYKASVASRLDAMSDTISGNKEELTRSVNELRDNLTATINSLDGKVDANNTEANTALNKLKKLQDDLQSGKVSVSDYEKVIADINGNISTLEAATGEKFESVKSDVRGLNNALEAYKASIASQLDAMSDTVNGNKEELTRSVNELRDNLTATINSLDGKVDANNTDANAALNNLKQLQADLQSGKVSVSDYESTVDSINKNVSSLEKSTGESLNSVKSSVNNVTSALDSYKASVNGQINNINSDISSVNSKINGITGDTSQLKKAVSDNTEKIKGLESSINELKKAVSDGKSKVAAAVTAKGVKTAADASFDTIAGNISSMAELQYNAGITFADGRVNADSANYKGGYSAGYSKGVSDADGRVNTNSANYKGGYNKGVSDADGRVNTNSANYKGGYSAGYSAGQQKAQLKTVELYYNNETFRLHDDGKQLPLNALHSELYNGDDHRDWTYQFYGYTNKGMDIVFVQTLELSDSNRAQWVVVGSYDSSTGAIRIDTNRSDAKDMRCRIYYY